MKLLITIISTSFLLLACHHQKSTTQSSHNLSSLTIHGKLEQKLNYCGGAKPTQDILDDLKKPKACKNYKLFVKKNDINHQNMAPIDSVITNEKGEFQFTLPQGDYIILSALQLNQHKFESNLAILNLTITNQNLLDNHFKNGLKQFSVDATNLTDLNILIQKKCDIPEGCLGVSTTIPPRP